ncbi:MAG: aminotransferase class IV, partial [Actinomycetota bacterium]|nr:aminotransferase class IV [Actinomycetota bacterium]
IARFDRSMSLMGMTSGWSLDQLERAVAETTLANPGANLVKLTAAWVSTPVSTIPDTTVPLVAVAAIHTPLADPVGLPGVRVKTATSAKTPPDVLPPGLKVAAAYTSGIRQKMQARSEGYDDVVLRTAEGDLAESVSQSLFVVRGDLVLLPPLDVVLDGITRRMVLDMAHHLGFHSQVRGIFWDEVESADELFLCSTTNPVLPIRELDGRALPDPGDHTARLAAESSALLSGNHGLSSKWLTPLGPPA